jgi:hypothetical protein
LFNIILPTYCENLILPGELSIKSKETDKVEFTKSLSNSGLARKAMESQESLAVLFKLKKLIFEFEAVVWVYFCAMSAKKPPVALPDRELTRDDIITTTGIHKMEEIEDLEILFKHCTDIGGLEECTALRRFALINNGLRRINNLATLGYTLVQLTLCDQEITVMENLDLPNLRELFLQRNQISRIDGLSGCPRLRKLWLCQNRITQVNDLHSVPELEECWLQANSLSSLVGIEHCPSLTNLGIAGNPISDFKELNCLSSLSKLVELSLSDVHFGRAPLTDDEGYKEYIICHVPAVQILDGVLVTSERRLAAQAEHDTAMAEYMRGLTSVEEDFRSELQTLSSRHKSKENHCAMLEREMADALRELQVLVGNARTAVKQQTVQQEQVMESNLIQLTTNLQAIAMTSKGKIDEGLITAASDFDLSESTFYVLEKLLSAEGQLVEMLCSTNTGAPPEALGDFSGEEELLAGRILFHSVSDNSPDFQWFSELLQGKSGMGENGDGSSSRSSKSESSGSSGISRLAELALVRLFKLATPRPLAVALPRQDGGSQLGRSAFDWAHTTGGRRVYTIMTPNALSLALQGKWAFNPPTSSSSSATAGSSCVLSSHASSIAHLMSCFGDSFIDPLVAYPEDDDTPDSQKPPGASDILKEFEKFHSSLAVDRSGKSSKKKKSTLPEVEPINLHRLDTSRNSKVLLLVCCRMDVDRAQMTEVQDEVPGSNGVLIPTSDAARADMVLSLSASKKSVAICLDPMGSSGSGVIGSEQWLYSLPSDKAAVSLWPEFASIIATPPPDGALPGSSSGGLNLMRILESRVEAMSVPSGRRSSSSSSSSSPSKSGPSTSFASSTSILQEFDTTAASLVQVYIDQVLEEVDPEKAEWLKAAETDVLMRETGVRRTREAIEGERRQHESILKDLRNQQQQLTHQSSNSDLSGPQRRDSRRR